MSSRDEILSSIKNNNVVKNTSLPDFLNFGITYENKIEKFKEMVKSVGGEAICIKKEQLDETIKGLYPQLKVIASNVEGFTLSNLDANEQELPHTLKDLELAVVKGEFAVAENGAVWVQNSQNRHRSLYFIAHNIIIVVNKADIVNNMHEAYEKISFENSTYGVFISGPSKTADIEQSLVIGAHGPKSGYVIFVE
ncbi:MAG: LutC/YkgG family protein [Halarcobacter sp.]